MSQNTAAIRNFVQSLNLPEPLSLLESAPEFSFSDGREAVTVGSQLAEFTPAVPASAREPLANSLLLAQLAANKQTSQSQDVFEWYSAYSRVLQGIGWQMQDVDFQTETVQDRNASVHKAIIPVITAILGPQMAAASIVVNILNGLQEMDKDSPWITFFDRESRHATGAKFQLNFVDADANGNPQITLLCFAIKAEKTITQVLFFKFSAQRAELKKGQSVLTVTRDRLESDKQLIADKVQRFIADFVANVEI